MAGITHVGVTHDDGRALVLRSFCENVVTELAKLAENRFHVCIILGVATAVVGVHVGDVYINDNSFCHSHFIITETLLDTGVGTVPDVAFLIIILYVSLARSTRCRGPPEEIKTICISNRAPYLSKADRTSICSVRVI